ncbi:Metallo-hydrolase/oxidoreductase [Thozetella sp. PMI_491]|nr:Metallo-hydrolase/oxidoreductase [Thozetella sp. PMI_491]
MRAAPVRLFALSAGRFSLPEEQFVSPSIQGARNTVPSLSFLIQHACPTTGKKTNIVFDLGLRRDTQRYAEPIRRHVESRQPMTTDPDVVKSLAAGGLTPDDIDYVIYSHVHWDHVGEPRDFPRSTFIVGHGSLDILDGTSISLRGGHSFFEADLLDRDRTIELSDPQAAQKSAGKADGSVNFSRPWQALDNLPATLDIFGDGSAYIVNAPGHLPGHINLLVSTSVHEGKSQWAYLAGDACHDRRILRREKDIGEWVDVHGQTCCIHADRAAAEQTIQRIRELEEKDVEVIFAHDVEWEKDERNQQRFFGA